MNFDRIFIILSIITMASALGVIAILSSDVVSFATPAVISTDLLDKQQKAYEDFLERNNFHQIRISEYEKYWGDSTTNEKLDQILNHIKDERTIIENFDPKQPNWKLIQDEFRYTNDKVVSDLVSILISEYDSLDVSNMPDMERSLLTQKMIALKITATSFPGVTNQSELVAATVKLGEQTEEIILLLEQNDISLKPRYDVKEVGDDKNNIQVLYSVIKCQQELRINAEDYMSAKIAISNQS